MRWFDEWLNRRIDTRLRETFGEEIERHLGAAELSLRNRLGTIMAEHDKRTHRDAECLAQAMVEEMKWKDPEARFTWEATKRRPDRSRLQPNKPERK